MDMDVDVDQVQQYVASGMDAVRFKLVRNVEELDNQDGFFPPDMCHQVFGEHEQIFGYRNLKINLFYDAQSLRCYVSNSYDSKVDDMNADLKPKDFMEELNDWLPANYCTERNDFVKLLSEKGRLKPFGANLNTFKLRYGSKKGVEYEVFTCTNNDAGYEEFHERMETLIVWFIDAANFIDMQDVKWRFFIIYEKHFHNDSSLYYPVGYSTVYEYYAYPSSRRYRISQFIIFPPYQNKGLGTKLLESIYQYFKNVENVYDITVEDPSDKFQMIRDTIDVKKCLSLPCFNRNLIKRCFNKTMIDSARKHFFITKKQCRRVYELIRLYYCNIEDEREYKEYTLMIKNRLNSPFKKKQSLHKRINKLYVEEKAVYDERMKVLQRDTDGIIEQYHQDDSIVPEYVLDALCNMKPRHVSIFKLSLPHAAQ